MKLFPESLEYLPARVALTLAVLCIASISAGQQQASKRVRIEQTSSPDTGSNSTFVLISDKTGSSWHVQISDLTHKPAPIAVVADFSSSAGNSLGSRLPIGTYTIKISANYRPPSFEALLRPGYDFEQEVVISGETTNLVTLVEDAPGTVGRSNSGRPTDDASTQTSSIAAAIDRIAGGPHQDLPAPIQSFVRRGQSPGWTIENGTVYALHLYLSGPVDHDYVIAAGQSMPIDLPPGSYRIAADVPDPSVIPFYAVRALPAGARWTSHFYIQAH